ncbi:hypothetical protein TSOC_009937 [Tetrabaena socialis]|uniref:Uncharacterized protein n=1 Tax=Tetrabaena socialis TaxID=47790 RepID=A0A2J7ZUL5_9CHLO|nr:hypothetical protein TSOC_009937 [Tetrabaena socialis]|eukprot:PNH03961.1 hypothetical protein TSOC_009937 [Tetrabaena socialis]
MRPVARGVVVEYSCTASDGSSGALDERWMPGVAVRAWGQGRMACVGSEVCVQIVQIHWLAVAVRERALPDFSFVTLQHGEKAVVRGGRMVNEPKTLPVMAP